jgi:hypothetical protein
MRLKNSLFAPGSASKSREYASKISRRRTQNAMPLNCSGYLLYRAAGFGPDWETV